MSAVADLPRGCLEWGVSANRSGKITLALSVTCSVAVVRLPRSNHDKPRHPSRGDSGNGWYLIQRHSRGRAIVIPTLTLTLSVAKGKGKGEESPCEAHSHA